MPGKSKKKKPVSSEKKKEILEELQAIIGLAEFYAQEARMSASEPEQCRKLAQKVIAESDDMEMHFERGSREPSGEKVGEAVKVPAGTSWMVFEKSEKKEDALNDPVFDAIIIYLIAAGLAAPFLLGILLFR